MGKQEVRCRAASRRSEMTPKKPRAPPTIDLLIDDANSGAMGFRFSHEMTELVEVFKKFKLRGMKVATWHPQWRWWGIMAYESPVSAPKLLWHDPKEWMIHMFALLEQYPGLVKDVRIFH